MNIFDKGILIVDDQSANVHLLEKLLRKEGYLSIRSTTDPVVGLEMMDERAPDLLLLDLHMPRLDGFEFLQEMANRHPADTTYLPVLVLTADATTSAKQTALSLGAKDFVTKPFDQIEVALRVRNLLETRALHTELKNFNVVLASRVREQTQELTETVEILKAAQKDLSFSRAETIEKLAVAAEFRDVETANHIHRMCRYSELLARLTGADDREAEELRIASIMHDVGKIGIPDGILLKPGPLTPDERATMQTHTEIGYRILSGSRSSLLMRSAEIALMHHERLDGLGYPRRLSGAEVPKDARIVAIADVFDALTTDRVYRQAFTVEKAVDIMNEGRGSQFDPRLLDIFLDHIDDVLAIKRRHEDGGPSQTLDSKLFGGAQHPTRLGRSIDTRHG